MKIKSIKTEFYSGKVYDLTVKKNHNYYVSNCLVHNCHENSTVQGKHAESQFILDLFSSYPSGSELAIGGGNPLSFPDLTNVLEVFKNRGIISNLTVNSVHVRGAASILSDYVKNKLIWGLGISYFPGRHEDCVKMANENPNVVFHLIMGVHTVADLKRICNDVKNAKVLLLGYKQHGRGVAYYNPDVEKFLYEWYVRLHEFFKIQNLTVSFDNLGIRQMNLRRFFSDEEWSKFYMGDDGNFTMYVDAVKQEYAVSSTSKTRFKIGNKSVKEIFAHVRSIR